MKFIKKFIIFPLSFIITVVFSVIASFFAKLFRIANPESEEIIGETSQINTPLEKENSVPQESKDSASGSKESKISGSVGLQFENNNLNSSENNYYHYPWPVKKVDQETQTSNVSMSIDKNMQTDNTELKDLDIQTDNTGVKDSEIQTDNAGAMDIEMQTDSTEIKDLEVQTENIDNHVDQQVQTGNNDMTMDLEIQTDNTYNTQIRDVGTQTNESQEENSENELGKVFNVVSEKDTALKQRVFKEPEFKNLADNQQGLKGFQNFVNKKWLEPGETGNLGSPEVNQPGAPSESLKGNSNMTDNSKTLGAKLEVVEDTTNYNEAQKRYKKQMRDNLLSQDFTGSESHSKGKKN